MSTREELERRLTELPGVVRQPARRGHGYSYFVGDREIAHFHGDERLDVRLTKERIRRRLREGTFDWRVRTRGPSAEWVAVRVSEAPDILLAVALVEEAIRTIGGAG
ncbi:MAG: luciferase family protein [Thermoplasmata archaeon]